MLYSVSVNPIQPGEESGKCRLIRVQNLAASCAILNEHRSNYCILVCMLTGEGLSDSYRVCLVGVDCTLQNLIAVALVPYLLYCKWIRTFSFRISDSAMFLLNFDLFNCHEYFLFQM
jgi:hypothetical protein